MDGVNFFDIKTVDNGKGGEETHDDLGNKETRYIRILCREAKTANYGYSIYELEVYAGANEELRKLVQTGKDKLSQFEAGNKNGNISKKDYQRLEESYKYYLDLANGEKITDEEIGRFLKEVTDLNNSIENYVIYSKDELNELYESMLGYKEKDYTKDSFNGFEEQLSSFKDIIDQATDYKKVNDALKQLRELNDHLVKLDRSELEKLIHKYQELNEEDYTEDSWKQMNEVLKRAQDVYDNPSLNQEEVNQAVALFKTIQLVERGHIDELEELMTSIKESDYTTSSWKQFASIYQDAKEMINNHSNMSQKDIDDMIVKVIEGMKLLVKVGNVDDYLDTVNKINVEIGKLDQSKYTKDSWDKLQETLQKAINLAAKEDVSQEELDSMLESLNNAYTALEEVKTNTDSKDPSVKTGDSISLFSYVGLLVVALLCFVYVRRYE